MKVRVAGAVLVVGATLAGPLAGVASAFVVEDDIMYSTGKAGFIVEDDIMYSTGNAGFVVEDDLMGVAGRRR